jgi:hypothetical protein
MLTNLIGRKVSRCAEMCGEPTDGSAAWQLNRPGFTGEEDSKKLEPMGKMKQTPLKKSRKSSKNLDVLGAVKK